MNREGFMDKNSWETAGFGNCKPDILSQPARFLHARQPWRVSL